MSDSNGNEKDGVKVVCRNRKARHLYHIVEEYEAGLVLSGTEVKSLRAGKASLPDSYAEIRGDGIYLVGSHISEYTPANRFNHDPARDRKLLMNKKQITRLRTKVQERGFTLVPLELYFKNGWAKVTLALARGKKLYDKREDLKRKQAERETERALRNAGM